MTTTNHAKLSASKSFKWIRCAASANAEWGVPDEPTPYMEEGRLAHTLAERILKDESYADLDFPEEMKKYVDVYVDYIHRVIKTHRKLAVAIYYPDVYIEKRVDFSHVVPEAPEAFGTADAIIASAQRGTLVVVDFKYGYERVPAYENSQLLLYAMGALKDLQLYDVVESITLAIVQPRAPRGKGFEGVDTWTLTMSELRYWEGYIKAKAEEALRPDAPYRPHEKTCRYCKARPTCPALHEKARELDLRRMVESGGEDFLWVMDNSKLLRDFLDSVEREVRDSLSRGEAFYDYELIPGRGIRKLLPEKERELVDFLGEKAYIKKIKGVPELEKIVGDDPVGQELLNSSIYFHHQRERVVKKDASIEENDYEPIND